jgi:hypothetical protein
MAATSGNDLPLLLSHLARLQNAPKPAEATSPVPRTIRWAKQVYSTAVRLQFCFVYPDAAAEITDQQLEVDFGRAVENLINRASNAVVPLRVQETQEKLDEVLDRETGRELDDAITKVLAVAGTTSWGAGASPADPSGLEGDVDVAAKLAAWHQDRPAGKLSQPLVAPGVEPSLQDQSKAEFIASLALKLAVDRSPAIAQIPPKNARVVRDVSEALFRQSVSDLGSSGGDQRLQAIADNARRSKAKEGG